MANHQFKFKRLLSLLLLTVVILAGCGKSKNTVQKQTRFLMDTYVTIQIPGDVSVLPVIENAMTRIEEVENKFNILNERNALFGFNQHDEPVRDEEILKLIDLALRVGQQTDGAFDITVYPLIKEWGFFDGMPSIPKEATIQALLDQVGLENVELSGRQFVKKNTATQVDLGGIAKGYAVQEAIEVIQNAGITSALIDAGGDIYALGTLNGKPWKIGIRNPRGEGVIGVLDLSDLAVVTSGDYERFFEKDGKRYHHILNPETGYPAQGLISVTVITQNAALADALSTALFVMGQERALAYLNSDENVEGVLITENNEIVYSDGLK